MKSCDKVLCSKIFDSITYNDMTLFGGISNNLRYFIYSGEKVYFPEGRGYVDFTKLLTKMKIAYDNLTVDQLMNIKNTESIVVFLPKDVLENVDSIKNDITGIYTAYSAFSIKQITDSMVTLFLHDDKIKYEKTLQFSSLQNISKLSAKPLQHTMKIINIDKHAKIKKEDMIVSLKNQLNCFLTNNKQESEGTVCIQGPQFYDEFVKVLKELTRDIQDKVLRIKLFVFVGSLNAGGKAFYRHDFLKSLLSLDVRGKKNTDFIKYSINELECAIIRWNKIARTLRCLQRGEFEKFDLPSVIDMLKEIKKHEIDAVMALLENFNIMEEILWYGK